MPNPAESSSSLRVAKLTIRALEPTSVEALAFGMVRTKDVYPLAVALVHGVCS